MIAQPRSKYEPNHPGAMKITKNLEQQTMRILA